MKNMFSAMALTVALMSASSAAFAQEVAMRSGVVVGIKAVQAAAAAPREQSETGRRLGGALGRVIGHAVQRNSGYYYGYEAANAGEAIGEAVGSSGGRGSAGGASSYLVMVEFDDGGKTAIKQASANGLQVGSRVYVMGEGSQAEVVAE